jgi:hypothetical protein
MKPLSYYKKIIVDYPSKNQYEKVYYYKRGRLIAVKEQFNDDFKEPEICTREVIFDEVSFQSHLKLYNEEVLRLQTEFRNDLIEKYEMAGHPKVNQCFDMAWDFGQSSSYEDVEDYFMNLINLIDMRNNLIDTRDNPIDRRTPVGGGTSNPFNIIVS